MSPCRTCIHARPATLTDRLECHRFPPVMGMDGFPHVSVENTCGEHSPLSAQIVPSMPEPAPAKSAAQTSPIPAKPKAKKKN